MFRCPFPNLGLLETSETSKHLETPKDPSNASCCMMLQRQLTTSGCNLKHVTCEARGSRPARAEYDVLVDIGPARLSEKPWALKDQPLTTLATNKAWESHHNRRRLVATYTEAGKS